MNSWNAELEEKAKKIKLIILDVDGVLTDGRLVIGDSGQEFKFFQSQDGTGIYMAMRAGVAVALLSGRESEASRKRASELGVEFWQEGANKQAGFEKIRKKHGVREEETACVGDDLADLALSFPRCGLSIAVRNAIPEVRKAADYTTQLPGGRGAVREIMDLILRAQGLWKQEASFYGIQENCKEGNF